MRPFALIADGSRPGPALPPWLAFGAPTRILRAERLEQVLPQLAEVEAAVAEGAWAVGFLAYEAAPALDPSLRTHPPHRRGDGSTWPLAFWALCPPPTSLEAGPRGLPDLLQQDPPAAEPLAWSATLDARHHRAAIDRIRRHIAEGDTYQVNFTFPLEAPWDPADPTHDATALFAQWAAAQRARHAMYLDLGDLVVASLSPELFVARNGAEIRTRPMKGTARRAPSAAADQVARQELFSEKNRAENLMIVDMMRNDLGKVADQGSVRVTELFGVETYPTVHQLVSEVRATSTCSQVELLRALFPCASITGAPKQRTMALVEQLEIGPRGIYTGAMGYWAPGRRLALAVAIRSVVLDRVARKATFGTGGGVVWDSRAAAEYHECQTKALFLTRRHPRFRLLETMVWRRRSGIFLAERHAARLATSAAYFGFPPPPAELFETIATHAASYDPSPAGHRLKLRLLYDEDGSYQLELSPLPCTPRQPLRLMLDDRPTGSRQTGSLSRRVGLDPADARFLCHKTTHRELYQAAASRHPEADEVILWNERHELTESVRFNLVVQLDGQLWTPPVSSGLLPGTYREELLARGRLRERVLFREDLGRAEKIWLINSVQGWRRGELLRPAPTDAASPRGANDTAPIRRSGARLQRIQVQ